MKDEDLHLAFAWMREFTNTLEYLKIVDYNNCWIRFNIRLNKCKFGHLMAKSSTEE